MSLSRFLVVASTTALLAAPARAQFNNPDLLDVFGHYSSSGPLVTSAGTYSKWYSVGLSELTPPYAAGGLYAKLLSSEAWVSSGLYEPDTVKRNSGKGKMSQKAWVSIAVGGYQFGFGGFTYGPIILESCKAKGSWDNKGGKYITQCGADAFAALGLSQRAIDHIQFYFSFKNLKFKKIKFMVKQTL